MLPLTVRNGYHAMWFALYLAGMLPSTVENGYHAKMLELAKMYRARMMPLMAKMLSLMVESGWHARTLHDGQM